MFLTPMYLFSPQYLPLISPYWFIFSSQSFIWIFFPLALTWRDLAPSYAILSTIEARESSDLRVNLCFLAGEPV